MVVERLAEGVVVPEVDLSDLGDLGETSAAIGSSTKMLLSIFLLFGSGLFGMRTVRKETWVGRGGILNGASTVDGIILEAGVLKEGELGEVGEGVVVSSLVGYSPGWLFVVVGSS